MTATERQPYIPRDSSLTQGITYTHPLFHLHLVQKKETPSKRPIVDATKLQRLSFYRTYSATTSKVDIVASQYMDINSYVWIFLFTIFFKSLPHSFVHFFLATYAPEEHIFVTKMVPFSHGLKYLFVFVGLMEVLIYLDMNRILFHYTVTAAAQNNPWNRCLNKVVYAPELNASIHCYQKDEFAEMFVNRTMTKFYQFSYISDDNEYFQISQIEYYRTQVEGVGMFTDISMFLMLLGLLQFLVLYASKAYFWKILNAAHWSVNLIDVMCFGYILSTKFTTLIPVSQVPKTATVEDSGYWATGLDMLAESISAPPVVHYLTSRSEQEINPTIDSTIMVTSNAIVYIFRGLMSHEVRDYCEKLLHTVIPITQFNEHTWLYIWPIFWNSFFLGDIYSVVYFIVKFITEYTALIILYKCLLETIIYEWPHIKTWMVMIGCCLFAFVARISMSNDSRVVLWAYGKGIATLAETIFIYMLYPLGRLVDDYTFHYGIPPTRLRIISLQIVPIYYFVKFYMLIRSLWHELKVNPVEKDVYVHYLWSWSLMVLPIIFGMLYIIYKYLVTFRATWTYIFRPLPKWGPRDFTIRQLRKQYDSRFYIRSEVPKLLSRYLTSKRDSKVYKVDVRYDFYRRSTVSPMAVRFGND